MAQDLASAAGWVEQIAEAKAEEAEQDQSAEIDGAEQSAYDDDKPDF